MIDLDRQEMPDSDHLNHPGLFGWTWSKKKKEAERQADADADASSEHSVSSDDSCEDLQKSMRTVDRDIDEWSVTTGGKGHTRVKNRTIAALEKVRLNIRSVYEDKDCSGQNLDEQSDEFDARLAEMMGQYQSDTTKRAEGSSNLTYVAAGVGALVVIGVIIFATRK
tara:strand:+ start:865 stop:1365 length:501 start_codon:yes stop_codon:yes gene_type:complete